MNFVQAAESCRPMHRLVQRAQAQRDTAYEAPTSRKIVTPANLLSLARPVIAGCIARNIAKKRPVRSLAAVMIATDAEGVAARKIDQLFPNCGRGATVYGTRADVMADTSALMITASALLLSPKTDFMSRMAIGLIGAQEVHKSIWAIRRNQQYRQATNGNYPTVQPSAIGKESMLEKFMTTANALSAHEAVGVKRVVHGIAALGLGILSVLHAESARRDYMASTSQSIAELQAIPQPKT